MSEHKRCPRCGEIKDLEDFPLDASRKSGRYPYCKACHTHQVRAHDSGRPPKVGDMTPEEFMSRVDFRAAPDGADGFHYRYTGPIDSEGEYAHQRFSQLADDHPLPKATTFWCWDEFPWCVNVDHATPMGELPSTTIQDLEDCDDGQRRIIAGAGGFSYLTEVGGMTPAEQLSALEKTPREPGDAEADRWVREHGGW